MCDFSTVGALFSSNHTDNFYSGVVEQWSTSHCILAHNMLHAYTESSTCGKDALRVEAH